MYKPERECIDHLNVYSKSKSPLGRLLTNFAKANIITPDGEFSSVEAYWYWLSIPDSNPNREKIRTMSGFRAKSFGRELRKSSKEFRNEPLFEQKIRLAIRYKLCHADKNIIMRKEGHLPLAHYYIVGDKVKDVSPKFAWLRQVWAEELAYARSKN